MIAALVAIAAGGLAALALDVIGSASVKVMTGNELPATGSEVAPTASNTSTEGEQ